MRLDGWGNARDVDKVWKASLQQRADRVVSKPEGQTIEDERPSAPGLEKTIQQSDVKPALQNLIQARCSNASPSIPSFAWENLPVPNAKTQENLGFV